MCLLPGENVDDDDEEEEEKEEENAGGSSPYASPRGETRMVSEEGEEDDSTDRTNDGSSTKSMAR